MKQQSLIHLMAVVAAVHVATLNWALGQRHIGYLLTATLSATLVWGAVHYWNERKRRAGCWLGVLIGLAVQQVAYQVWRTELSGFWWPLAQFGALHCLVACGLGKAAS